jgi:hypothetical protein
VKPIGLDEYQQQNHIAQQHSNRQSKASSEDEMGGHVCSQRGYTGAESQQQGQAKRRRNSQIKKRWQDEDREQGDIGVWGYQFRTCRNDRAGPSQAEQLEMAVTVNFGKERNTNERSCHNDGAGCYGVIEVPLAVKSPVT